MEAIIVHTPSSGASWLTKEEYQALVEIAEALKPQG